jgi:hypothetical protein
MDADVFMTIALVAVAVVGVGSVALIVRFFALPPGR